MERLYGLAHVSRWKPYDLCNLVRVSWVGSVLDRYRPSITYHNGRYRITVDHVNDLYDLSDLYGLDRDLSEV